MQSKKYTLNQTDWKKIGLGALIAISGALLTYITEIIPNVDLGETWTPIVMTLWTIIANTARRFLIDSAISQ